MSNYLLKKINQIVLLGGGAFLYDLSLFLKGKGIPFFVLTSPRHAKNKLNNMDHTLVELLASHNINYYIVEDWRKAFDADKIEEMRDTFALSIGAAWIFQAKDVEKIFHGRLFNLHGTRLPTYRGGGGFSWQILNGNHYGFCALHRIDAGIDSGDLLAYEEFLYPTQCRIPSDYQSVYREKSLIFLAKIIDAILVGDMAFKLTSQPEYLSQYWPRLHTETHSWIDWSMPIDMLDRFICAFDDPYSGAKSMLHQKVVRLKSSIADYHDGRFHPFQYGIVYRNNGKWLCVAANGGTLILQQAFDEKNMNILGDVKVGERFYTTTDRLSQWHERVIYTSRGTKRSCEDNLSELSEV